MNLIKSNLILGAVAVALLVPTMITLSSERELFKDIGGVPLLFDGFSGDNVAGLVLAVPKAEQPPAAQTPQGQDQKQPQVAYDELVFQRPDQRWRLGAGANAGTLAGAFVNGELLEQHFFEHLELIPRDPETLVYENATEEQLAEVGLDLLHAFRIKAVNAQQQPVAELLIGPMQKARGKESATGVYLRALDSNEVLFYEGEGRLPFAMRQTDPRIWLDKTIARFDPETIRTLSIRNPLTGEKPFVFTKSEGSGLWECKEPPAGFGALRQGEVARLAQTFCNLIAQDVLKPVQGTNIAGLGLYPGTAELSITSIANDEQKTEKTVHLWSGDAVEDKNEHYLRVDGNPFLMTWGAHYANKLENPGQLFDPAASKDDDGK